jgi:hypothetical protein
MECRRVAREDWEIVMSHGLATFKSNGALSFSSDDVTWNQVDFFYVTGNSDTTKDFPVLAGKEVMVVQIMIDAPPIDRKALAHTIIVSGTSVQVSGGSEKAYILVLMR